MAYFSASVEERDDDAAAQQGLIPDSRPLPLGLWVPGNPFSLGFALRTVDCRRVFSPFHRGIHRPLLTFDLQS